MLTAKKVHLILITPALLLTLFLAGCLDSKKCSTQNTESEKTIEEEK